MQPLSDNTINVPAFLSKLWKMVNDPGTDHVISWSSGGKSFIIQNQAQFWYELLPVYYKHNNMSSFVRQLNMYGFHKMSTTENGSMDIEKDEIQFHHSYFQRDAPELLKHIKRKVTGTKGATTTSTQNNMKSDDLSKVLSDVKYLRGKQASVDSQLLAMKQENSVLWRELAILRQKHMKQQQIVNKLIQFLVTIVQPASRMGGLGVKRRYPLMIHESPPVKKQKKKKSSTTSEGPTIHELDNTDILPEELLADDGEEPNSPITDLNCQTKTSSDLLDEVCSISQPIDADILLDSPEYVDSTGNPVEELLANPNLPNEPLPEQLPADDGEILENFDATETALDVNGEKVFLNPTTQDTLLSNLINGSYNIDLLNGNAKDSKRDQSSDSTDLTVARVDYSRLNSTEDLDFHVENTQSEIEQLKDILNGCSTFDANALLGLFNDDAPDYGLTYNQGDDTGTNKSDPLLSGSKLTPYSAIDFSQLFDDSSDANDTQLDIVKLEPSSTINTPQVMNDVPEFPVVNTKNKTKLVDH